MLSNLPIYEIIAELKESLSSHSNIVLQAPPGAGKTTIVPLELLNEKWMQNRKIIMLEPRRLAARAAAMRMASILGEQVGDTVGYSVRMDNKVGPNTRIEVVTEGILIRKLQADPELKGVGMIVFDEFHERSIDADLGLALTLDVQAILRDDLNIMVMSATLDGEKISALMSDAPIITSMGRSYDIDYRYLKKKISGHIEYEITETILKSLNEEEGSILVFLPGAKEIKQTEILLKEKISAANIMICPLFGMMPLKDQDQAIQPPPKGYRKVVLATAIAETSLTIEGIRIVIDSGLQRLATYDVKTGMTQLITSTVSLASADQRAGRAGRTEEGVCYRMWTAETHRALIPYTDPEIKRADLVPACLELASWGVRSANELKWIDVPDEVSMKQAKELLVSLGALDANDTITSHGKEMTSFPTHPRLAHMILKAKNIGESYLALMIAALLEEKDILHLSYDMRTADVCLRIEALNHVRTGNINAAKKLGCNILAAQNILKQIKIWQKLYSINDTSFDIKKAGLCLAFAFPDRIAGMRPGQTGIYLLSGGRGARLWDNDPLSAESFLAVGHLDKGNRDALIFSAASISKEDLENNFTNLINMSEEIGWDDRNQKVSFKKQIKIGYIPLTISTINNPDPEVVLSAMIEGIRKMGLERLPWTEDSISFCRRANLVHEFNKETFPSFSDQILIDDLENWLAPYLNNVKSRSNLATLDLYAILKSKLTWQELSMLDELAPMSFKVPSGSNIKIDYAMDPPILPVKLQEMFGAEKTPTIMAGKMTLNVHLLSPARRPLQITNDLSGFWRSSYHEVKKEMKGRYPKHPWPDDPMQALPTKKLKPR